MSATGISTTYPYTDPATPRHQCDECGAWERPNEYGSCRLRHAKWCESKPQPEHVTAPVAHEDAPAAPDRGEELSDFASSVRRTGLGHGRDEDILEAVRSGYLSVSEAMNLDD